MSVLIQVVLPVFLVAGIAGLAHLRLHFDVDTLSRSVFYLFAPALVFDSLVASDVSGEVFGQIALVIIAITLVLWALAAGLARLLRLEGPTQAAFLVAVVLMNAGNFGLPLSLFAFGEAGLARATLYFAVSAMLSASLGVYLNARGQLSPWAALKRVFGMPLTYAAALGLALNLTHLAVPEPLLKSIHLLGQASVPVMLAVLGVKLAGTFRRERSAFNLPALGAVAVLRLLVAPALAWLAAMAIGLSDLALDAAVLQSAMPTAVITTILSTEFDSDPPFAALCVLVTTLGSLVTVTLLLNVLS